MAERVQVGRKPSAPQPLQLVEACPMRAPLTSRVTYRSSLRSALRVAIPWVAPCASTITRAQDRACASPGVRLKATIAATAVVAISILLMALSLLITWFCGRSMLLGARHRKGLVVKVNLRADWRT